MSNARLKLAKNQANAKQHLEAVKQMLSNTSRLNFCYLKIIHILHLCYQRKIIGHIKNKEKNKCVCIHEIIRFNHSTVQISRLQFAICEAFWEFENEFLHFFLKIANR